MELFAWSIINLKKGWQDNRFIVGKWYQIFNLEKKRKRKYANIQFIIHWHQIFPLRAGRFERTINWSLFLCVCVRGSTTLSGYSMKWNQKVLLSLLDEKWEQALILPLAERQNSLYLCAMGWLGPHHGTGLSLAWHWAAVSQLRWQGLGSVFALVSQPRPSQAADRNDLNNEFTPGDAGLICRWDGGKTLDVTDDRTQKTPSWCS